MMCSIFKKVEGTRISNMNLSPRWQDKDKVHHQCIIGIICASSVHQKRIIGISSGPHHHKDRVDRVFLVLEFSQFFLFSWLLTLNQETNIWTKVKFCSLTLSATDGEAGPVLWIGVIEAQIESVSIDRLRPRSHSLWCIHHLPPPLSVLIHILHLHHLCTQSNKHSAKLHWQAGLFGEKNWPPTDLYAGGQFWICGCLPLS